MSKEIKVVRSRGLQLILASSGVLILSGFLIIHIVKDLTSTVDAWYFHSTPVWIIIMILASLIYIRELQKLKKSGVDVNDLFSKLPPE
jgi:hypothetical protein